MYNRCMTFLFYNIIQPSHMIFFSKSCFNFILANSKMFRLHFIIYTFSRFETKQSVSNLFLCYKECKPNGI